MTTTTTTGNAPKASTVMRFYECVLQELHAVMDKCDLALYHWFENIPAGKRPIAVTAEMARIHAAAVSTQALFFENCQASRYATGSTPNKGVHLRVTSKLDQGAVSAGKNTPKNANRFDTRLSVAFAPGNAPQAPNQCPPIGFELFNQVDQVGVNYYPGKTSLELSGTAPGSSRLTLATSGHWKDMYVFELYGPSDISLRTLKMALSATAQVSNPKVYDHWVRFKPIAEPPVPPELLARAEPFAISAIEIDAPVEFYSGLPVGQRTQYWKVFADYSNADSGQVLYKEHPLEDTAGQVLPMGGYASSTELNFHTPYDEQVDSNVMLDTLDGTWTHRVCVRGFKKPSSQVSVKYNGNPVYTGSSEIGALFEVQYEPMVTEGIATAQETVTLRTVGLSKAAFRLVGIEAVPGFGVRATITVINELHFAACICTPFVSGVYENYATPQFRTPECWVVRNLQAMSESPPVCVLVPFTFLYATGIRSLTVNDLLSHGGFAYAAELGKFPDGIYGTYRDASNTVTGLYPDIGDMYPNSIKVPTGGPASLLAAYAKNGDRVMLAASYQAVEMAKFPINGAHAGMSPGDYATSFTVTVDWQAELYDPDYPNDPPLSILSGTQTWFLTGQEAVARYGRYLTLPVANAYTVLKPTAPWTNGRDQQITVYETWPGGDIHELETYMVDSRLRTFYSTPPRRNFTYTLIRAPYLVVEGAWFETNPVMDGATNTAAKVRTVIEQSASADSVRVVLMG